MADPTFIELTEALAVVAARSSKDLSGQHHWPVLLIDAAVRSEGDGDVEAQDILIEAIGTLIGLPVEQALTVEGAARLIEERKKTPNARSKKGS